jgi:acetolactate synthase-1/2/3 large subunit
MLVTDFIINYLMKHEKVTHVFTYAGGTDAPILNTLYHTKGICYIPTRHEQAASIAAIGYALASERLGVAVSMSGPGATNMVTGVADAWFDSVPILYLTGQVTRTSYKFDNPARQIGYQETDIVSIVKSITKKAELVIEKDKIPDSLRQFLSKAISGRPGPVLLDIPFDTLREDISEEGLNKQVILEEKPKVSSVIVDTFLKLVSESTRPLIIAGGGIRTREARDLLLQLAENLQIPVVTSLNGKDSFPNDNPLYFGFIGAYGNRYSNIAMANSDLLIAIGSRLDSRQTSNPKYFARAAYIVHVDIDRNELNNNIKADIAVHADLIDLMKKILEKTRPIDRSKYKDWKEYFAKLKKEFDVVNDCKGTTKNVHPKQFLLELSKQNNEKTIYLADVGNNQMFAAQSLIVKKNQRFITSGGLGTMGFALPASIGARFGSMDSLIIPIMGDGGFQMALQELQTIMQFNLPIKIIILNNNILGLMKVFQDENYEGAYPATVDCYSAPNLEKVAYAYGLKFKKVETTEEAINFIPEFLKEKGPFILEVCIHKDWTGYPKMRGGFPIEYQNPPIPDEKLKEFMLIPIFKKD